MTRNILLTGGCGYVGSVLADALSDRGYFIRIVDSQWFGNFHTNPSKNIQILKKRVDEIIAVDLESIDTVIHLANIANDPGVELNPTLSWEINTLHLTELLQKCKNSTIETFINASSGSVYGIKEQEKVTEDLDLLPISTYNKTKMVAERICLSYSNDFRIVNVRPATVCGLSPRMRFDVVVNMFVLQAFKNGHIEVLGGNQIRPNIHIDDMVSVYLHLLNEGRDITGNLNAGFENISVLEIAQLVSKSIPCEIIIKDSNDPRSYRQDSTKLLTTGFSPKKNVKIAIEEISEKLQSGKLVDNLRWHTVAMMKELKLDFNYASKAN